MNLLDNQNINFIIGEHHRFSNKRPRGGHIVLHLLAYKLAERSHNVYMFAEPMYPHLNIYKIPQDYWEDPDPHSNIAKWTFEPFSYPLNKTVSVYPSDYSGNPFGTTHVTRWILDHTDVDIESSWQDTDVYFFNIAFFSTHKNSEKKFLNLIDYHFDELYDTNQQRKGFCYIPLKYTPENHKDIVKVFDAHIIDDWVAKGGYEYLRSVLNKYEYMLTFDTKTFLTQAAVLCGCKAIILESPRSPDFQKSLTPTQFRIGNPLQMFGTAFGIQDIAWADKTLHLARDYHKELAIIDEKTVDDFVSFWKNRLNV